MKIIFLYLRNRANVEGEGQWQDVNCIPSMRFSIASQIRYLSWISRNFFSIEVVLRAYIIKKKQDPCLLPGVCFFASIEEDKNAKKSWKMDTEETYQQYVDIELFSKEVLLGIYIIISNKILISVQDLTCCRKYKPFDKWPGNFMKYHYICRKNKLLSTISLHCCVKLLI